MSVRRTSPFGRPALVIFLIIGVILFIAAIWQLTVVAQTKDNEECNCSGMSQTNKSALIFWGVFGMIGGLIFAGIALYYFLFTVDRSNRRLYRLK
jgi:uncharacterized BrkB/YihY/UPF0761 family membrane protein